MNSFSKYVMDEARKRGIHLRLAHAARRCGLDIRESSKHPNLVEYINDRKIDVVLDIGANSGQFGQKFGDLLPVKVQFSTVAPLKAGLWDTVPKPVVPLKLQSLSVTLLALMTTVALPKLMPLSTAPACVT
jgi:hypothetical protein